MHTIAFTLEDLIAKQIPALSVVETGTEGYRVLSAPEGLRPELERRFPRYIVGGMQRYRRHYIDMSKTFDVYLANFSSKTRSTLKRKRRKLEEVAAGTLEIVSFRTPDEMACFFDEAVPLSRKTYQARLLDAGLPEAVRVREEGLKLAAQDKLRAFLLRINGRAIAYLYLPVEGRTLKYAYLGYDPGYAQYSPGTVLQLCALEYLFAERRFSYFDFTEGEGTHKAQFGTDSIAVCSFLLLRPSLANYFLIGSLALFDSTISLTKQLVGTTKIGRIRRMLRA